MKESIPTVCYMSFNECYISHFPIYDSTYKIVVSEGILSGICVKP